MSRLRNTICRRADGALGLLLGLFAVATPRAQESADPAAAIERWLASEHDSEELMAETVKVVCDAEVGLRTLGAMQPMLAAEPPTPRTKALRSLLTQVALEHLRRTYKSGMTFVGQYNGLRALQPWLDPLLFDLLLDTPEWYPLTFRVRLVPAIRDLHPKLPSGDRVAAVIQVIEDEREPTGLRHALAAMLWQWDNKKYGAAFVRQLQLATTEGDGEDRVNATLELADYFNLLREYKRAAGAHRAAQALARGAGVELQPVSWYSAACVHALLGDTERGMQALQRCAEMHASPHLDRSRRLERKLFENDPEIAALRSDKRFPALLKLAFGDASDESDEGGR